MTADNVDGMDKSHTLVLLSPNIVKDEKTAGRVVEQFKDAPVFHHQVLDRVTTGAIKLNSDYYTYIYIADVPDSKVSLADGDYEAIFKTLAPGGVVDGDFDLTNNLAPLLAGFIVSGQTLSKPAKTNSGTQTLKKTTTPSIPSKRGTGIALPQFKRLANLSLNDDDDDEIIDENELVEDDLAAKIVVPQKCDPGPGKKRRKACKDCSCGLKDLEQEDIDEKTEKQNQVVTLSNDDTAEVDFTVPGKTTGSCGSCSLGDAFRCDGCPYIGLPPFKPGEVVSISALGGDDL